MRYPGLLAKAISRFGHPLQGPPAAFAYGPAQFLGSTDFSIDFVDVIRFPDAGFPKSIIQSQHNPATLAKPRGAVVISPQVRQYFAQPRKAKISLPLKGGASSQLSCQMEYQAPDLLLVRFPETSEPLSLVDLDPQGTAFCFCSGPDLIYNLYARIDKLLGDREVRLVISEATSYPQRRRFFRVDAEVTLRCWPAGNSEELVCKVEAKTVDLSAVGLRLTTSHQLKPGERLEMAIALPAEPPELVRCSGRVVRIDSAGDDHESEAAIDLVRIKPEDQEKLIKFCLEEQRRQIRLKVRVLDSFGN